MLWNKDFLDQYTLPGNKTLASKVREEVLQYGVESADLTGVLASIIDDVPDQTLNYLIKHGLRVVAEMTPEEFMKLPGIGRKKAVRLAAAFELARRLARLVPENKPQINSPESAAALVKEEMRYLDREHFLALLLDTKNQVLSRETISIGTLNSSAIHPRELFKMAIRRSAAAVLLVHNHPSGDPTPSRQDIEVTKRLIEVGNIIGINVLDHLVIGDNQFISFKSRGLM